MCPRRLSRTPQSSSTFASSIAAVHRKVSVDFVMGLRTSLGFPSCLPSSPLQKPQDLARQSFNGDGHRMEKQSVDETVGMLPPQVGKRCHKCWGFGHLHAQCPSRNGGANAKNSRDGSWKQCRFCRERGHVYSDCPHAPPPAAGNINAPISPARIVPSSPPRALAHLY